MVDRSIEEGGETSGKLFLQRKGFCSIVELDMHDINNLNVIIHNKPWRPVYSRWIKCFDIPIPLTNVSNNTCKQLSEYGDAHPLVCILVWHIQHNMWNDPPRLFNTHFYNRSEEHFELAQSSFKWLHFHVFRIWLHARENKGIFNQ